MGACSMDCNSLGFTVRGIFQARILECFAISSSKGNFLSGTEPKPPLLPVLQADSTC